MYVAPKNFYMHAERRCGTRSGHVYRRDSVRLAGVDPYLQSRAEAVVQVRAKVGTANAAGSREPISIPCVSYGREVLPMERRRLRRGQELQFDIGRRHFTARLFYPESVYRGEFSSGSDGQSSDRGDIELGGVVIKLVAVFAKRQSGDTIVCELHEYDTGVRTRSSGDMGMSI